MYINGGGDPVISSTSTIAYNTWNHIAIVRQGTSLKLYLNGALNTTVTISAGLGWYLSASGLRIVVVLMLTGPMDTILEVYQMLD